MAADNEIVLYDYGDGKLAVVKLLKETLGLTVQEAKDFADDLANGPKSIKLYGAEAKKLPEALKALGVSFEHKQKSESSSDVSSSTTIGSKMLEELMKRIEALEARIAKLESNKGSNPGASTER